MWVDNMYVRIAEVTSTLDMQFKMLMALVDTPIIYGIIYLLKGKIDIARE